MFSVCIDDDTLLSPYAGDNSKLISLSRILFALAHTHNLRSLFCLMHFNKTYSLATKYTCVPQITTCE